MRVLFIGFQDIFGKVNSGGIQGSRRNYDLLSAMEGNETYVALLCEKGFVKPESPFIQYFEGNESNLDALKSAVCLRKEYKVKEEKHLIAYVKQINPAVVFLDGSLIGILLKKIPKHIRSVVYFHNIETDYSWNKVKNEGFWFLPSYWASYYNEKISVQRATKLIAINERDGHRLYELFGRTPDYYLPVTFYDKFDEKKLCREVEQKKLLFIGSLFPPNYQGVLWFVNEVMTKLSEYHLTIVGKNFELKRDELERENVTVVGTVDNLEEYYYSFPAIIMPIQYGAGMKVKTAEALMYGITVFATDEALEGYQVQGVEGIYRCNTENEFQTAIRKAFEERGIQALETDARNVFLKYHETKVQLKKFSNLLESMEVSR